MFKDFSKVWIGFIETDAKKMRLTYGRIAARVFIVEIRHAARKKAEV